MNSYKMLTGMVLASNPVLEGMTEAWDWGG